MEVTMKAFFLSLSLACCLEYFAHFAKASDFFEDTSRSEQEVYKKRKIESTIYTPSEIRNYLLTLDFERRFQKKEGIHISPLKLQKLLYYAQGYCLAIFNIPIFEEDFEKWDKGPVVPSEYHEFSRNKIGICRNNPILEHHCNSQFLTQDFQKITNSDIKIKKFLDTLYDASLFKSGKKLSDQTHKERPWQETPKNAPITKELMTDYFRGPSIFEFIKEACLTKKSEGVSYTILCEEALYWVNSVRVFLLSSSEKRLEEYQLSLDSLTSCIPDILLENNDHQFNLRFEGQTSGEAFLSNFFLPDLIINGFEHSLTYFQHQTIPTLLAFSAHYKNPIALFYLSKFFKEFDYENAENHFLTLSKDILTTTLSVQEALPANAQNKDLIGICYFYIADILTQEGDYGQADQNMTQAIDLLSISENSKFLLQGSKRVNDKERKKKILLKASGKGEVDAIFLLATLEETQEKKREKFKEASERESAQALYTLGGLLLREDPNSEEGILCLKKAIEKGSYGAALHLAQTVPSEAENAYMLAAEFGFRLAHYKKYELFIRQGKIEQAKQSLLQSGILLRDEELLTILSSEEKERISDDLETYWENISNIVGFDLTCDLMSSQDDS